MATRRKPAQAALRIPKHDHRILVLQGGGALGAYQAGVYEGMVERGVAPDWVTGVSIGAITAALIGQSAGTAHRALARVLGPGVIGHAAHRAGVS